MAVVKLAAAASGMTAVYTQMLESDLQHQVTVLQQVADLPCTCSFRCLGYVHNGLCRQSICVNTDIAGLWSPVTSRTHCHLQSFEQTGMIALQDCKHYTQCNTEIRVTTNPDPRQAMK